MKRILAVLGTVLALTSFSFAQGAEPLRVVLDKYELVRLNTDVATVLIANPDIADVAVEKSRLLFLIGRSPGETMLVLLDEAGREIMNTSIVVVPNLEREVTVHRGTRRGNALEATFSCAPRCTPIPNPGRRAPATGGGGGDSEEEDTESAQRSAAAAERQAAASERSAAANEKFVESKTRPSEPRGLGRARTRVR
jgi:hypothetical protein